MIQLRRIKLEGVDDSQYIHALTYVDLNSENFINIKHADVVRLRSLTAALAHIVAQYAVPDRKMHGALTVDQYDEYIKSFDLDISHVELDEDVEMPWQLRDYMDTILKGDGYTRTANLFKRSKKRDAKGRTAFSRYEDKAFACYESATMDLCNAVDTNPSRNPGASVTTAGEILRWLDRDVSNEPGCGPDISVAGVPRIRGTNSKFTLIDTHTNVGIRLRKHWRQREALSKAALELLYEEVEEDTLTQEQHLNLHERLNKIQHLHPERD